MAKLEEPQDIPSELLDGYRGALNAHPTGSIVKKRYPYRMPPMQEGGKGVYPEQREQRARFKEAIQDFKGISQADRERWYAAMPPWGSFLWYYNYFIMSSLAGNANAEQGGFGVIKTIQFVNKSIPTGGNEPITITEVDPAKTVVMLFGNSYISDKIQRGQTQVSQNSTVNINLSPSVDIALSEVILQGEIGRMDIGDGAGTGRWAAPYVVSLAAAELVVGLQAVPLADPCKFSWKIIEHKSQVVYPYVQTIAAEQINISWPTTPSVAAIIGATVIEYI